MTYTTLKVRTYTNLSTREKLKQDFGNCRFVYNWALSLKKEQYERYLELDKPSDFDWTLDLQSLLPNLKEENTWLTLTPAKSLQVVLHNLNQAFTNWFEGRSKYPCFKHKSFRDSLPLSVQSIRTIKIETSKTINIDLMGITFRCKLTQEVPKGKLMRGTLTKDVDQYHICLTYEVDECFHMKLPEHELAPVCGIDLGVVQPLTVSWQVGGEWKSKVLGLDEREHLKCLELRRKRYQRTYSRRLQSYRVRCKKIKPDKETGEVQRPSRSNLDKATTKVQRAYQKERFYRQEWAHKVSSQLAQRFSVIKFEDLKIQTMTRKDTGKSGLNREMLRLGLSNVVQLTEYKAVNYGRKVQFVNPRHTSQRCSASGCGHISKDSRESQALFRCVSCGSKLNADVNASRNIFSRLPLAA